MQSSLENCSYCESRATTRDHVPPTGFFPDPKPDDLITVPCCQKCNDSFKMDDEAFRAWIVAPENISEAGKWIREHKVYKQTFARSPKLVENIKLHMAETTVAGKTIDILNFPADRANRFIIRITKGLLSKFHPSFPRNTQQYEVVPVHPTAENLVILERARDAAVYDDRGDGVFQFRRSVDARAEWGYWLYTFYEASLFMVRHRTPPQQNGDGLSQKETKSL